MCTGSAQQATNMEVVCKQLTMITMITQEDMIKGDLLHDGPQCTQWLPASKGLAAESWPIKSGPDDRKQQHSYGVLYDKPYH